MTQGRVGTLAEKCDLCRQRTAIADSGAHVVSGFGCRG